MTLAEPQDPARDEGSRRLDRLPSRAAGRVGEPSLQALVAHARSVPSPRREAFAAALARLPEGPGHVVVHTCHRVELYVAPSSLGAAIPTLPPGAYALEDADAARHLIAVAAGLDSAVFGETQILHQLREVIAERHGERALDPVLDRLFQAALRAGRTARGWFSGPPRSLADVALDRIAARSGQLHGRRVAVVGVGRMGRLAAFAAGRRGCRVLVANRTAQRAAELAREVGGEVAAFGTDRSLAAAVAGESGLAGVVVAIGGPWLVGPLDHRALVDAAVPVVDLSSPPAVPATLQAGLGDAFVSVDDLAAGDSSGPGERLQRRLEQLVSETGREYCRWVRTREAVPAIQAVGARAEELRAAELAWLAHHRPGLSSDDLALIEQMSHRLVSGILHAPLAALHDDDSGDLERAARELFGV